MPVAWRILPAGQKHPWKGEWLALLSDLRRALPPGWTVLVLTDRGLYAKWLFRAIQRRGWHPFMRINTGGTFRPCGEKVGRPLLSLVPAVGSRWQGRGEAFQAASQRLRCWRAGTPSMRTPGWW